MSTIEFIIYCLALVAFTTIGLLISAFQIYLIASEISSDKTDKKDR